LLRDALNEKLRDFTPPYKAVLYRDPHGGRHIANAIITRLPVAADRTQLHGRRQRILEGHVRVHGHDLVVMATHWTSRVSDSEGEGREHYGNAIYGVYRAMYRSNPKVDFLVCGDFNDPPDEESVTKHLHAVGSSEFRRGSSDPLLLDLFADKAGGNVGTHFYHGKWSCFDQICVSPGMLDNEGWSCDPSSARIVNDLTADERGHPHRFGNEHDRSSRGWSDHFPVTVHLHVSP
jgi:endonuclease/exonuclease/phosphatase family metal-dependent hydrolase